MTRKYIILRRRNRIVNVEFLIAGIAIGMRCVNYFKIDAVFGLFIAIGSIFLMVVLFFRNVIFRIIFSILFSLGWAFLTYVILQLVSKLHTTAWLFAIIVFAISFWAHWKHFTFIRDAERHEYE